MGVRQPVPSSDKRRGLSVGLATLPRKRLTVMKTNEMPRNRINLLRRPKSRKQDLKVRNMLSWNRLGPAVKTIERLENINMRVTVVQGIRWNYNVNHV